MSEEEKFKNALVNLPSGAAEIALPKYRINAKGHHVPENLVKPVDGMRDDLVIELISKARALQQSMLEFKHAAFDTVTAFVDLSAEKYEVKIKSQKGNMTFPSFDGSKKVTIQIAERISFDERLQAAKALFDACIEKWSEGGNENLVVLIRDAFNVDKEGNIDARSILALRRHKIEDKDWENAMKAISDAVQVIGSTEYIRFYEKDGRDKFQAITLDFAGL
jgi:hypothetical protein